MPKNLINHLDMDVFHSKVLFLCLFALAAAIEDSQPSRRLPRYLVFPGMDAGLDEIAEWSTGYASPFNILFGPKPYVFGWMGEDTFIPEGEEEIEIEGEEGVEEGEEYPEEGEVDDGDPEYDYEKL